MKIQLTPVADQADIVAALAFLAPEPYADWMKIGMALKGWDNAQGLELYRSWSRRANNYDEQVLLEK